MPNSDNPPYDKCDSKTYKKNVDAIPDCPTDHFSPAATMGGYDPEYDEELWRAREFALANSRKYASGA